MRSEGESHPSLANTSVQKTIKMTAGLRAPPWSAVGWSVREVWAAHGSMRCISSINTGSVFLFIQSPVVITLSFCCLYFSSWMNWAGEDLWQLCIRYIITTISPLLAPLIIVHHIQTIFNTYYIIFPPQHLCASHD